MGILYNANGEYTDYGTRSGLDGQAGNAMSWLIWFRRTAAGSNSGIFTKGTLNNGWRILQDTTNGNLIFGIDRASGDTFCQADSLMTLNAWKCVVGTFDDARGSGAKWVVYDGNLTTALSSTTLSSNTDGSGAFTADTGNIVVGNIGVGASFNNPANGVVAVCAFYLKALTLNEALREQFGFWDGEAEFVTMEADVGLTQIDLRGGLTGTVTGSPTDDQDLPLNPPLWLFTDGGWAGVAGAVTIDADLTEGIDLGDTNAPTATLGAAVTEGLNAGDTKAPLATLLAALADGVLTGDAFVVVATLAKALTDGTKLGDTVAGQVLAIVSGSQTEGAKLGDTEAALLTALAATTEGVSLGDAVVAAATLLASTADGATFGDTYAPIATLATTLNEGITLGDALAAGLILPAAWADGITLGDTMTGATVATVPSDDAKKTDEVTFQAQARAATFQERAPAVFFQARTFPVTIA